MDFSAAIQGIFQRKSKTVITTISRGKIDCTEAIYYAHDDEQRPRHHWYGRPKHSVVNVKEEVGIVVVEEVGEP